LGQQQQQHDVILTLSAAVGFKVPPDKFHRDPGPQM